MPNLNMPLPVVQLNGPGMQNSRVTPLQQALAQDASALFQSNASIQPIPQGGPFLLEIPLNR
jgi:hypothetical protein